MAWFPTPGFVLQAGRKSWDILELTRKLKLVYSWWSGSLAARLAGTDLPLPLQRGSNIPSPDQIHSSQPGVTKKQGSGD